MSLHPHVIAPVPEDTARVARAAFPKGHPSLTFRDALGVWPEYVYISCMAYPRLSQVPDYAN
jgi:hypothetical protein